MYKLIMLNNPILVSGEEINEYTKPCYCFNSIKNTWGDDVVFYQGAMPKYHYKGFQKIIAGIPELPSIDFSELSEEDCKKIGWVDVKKLAYLHCPEEPYKWADDPEQWDDINAETRSIWIDGFKAAQSLNEKKFSEEDVRKAIEMAREADSLDGVVDLDVVLNFPNADNSDLQIKYQSDEIIQSLSQPKVFDVEVEMKTKCYCGHTDWCDCSENQGSPFIQQPKITNSSIKVIKVL